jgi:hypothetical protein
LTLLDNFLLTGLSASIWCLLLLLLLLLQPQLRLVLRL